MDAISDSAYETVVVMSSAQVGKTEVILNSIGFGIEHDPSPMLVVHPTLDMAQAFSKDKFAPMLRDTPCLVGKVGEPRGRDGGNNILHKQFAGGHITMGGANSPASLAARSVRRVYSDDIDRFPPSAGAEGDPLKLARKRATTFWNRKYVETSTPTIKDVSRIEKKYKESDQRRFYVPCVECGKKQAWDQWKDVAWDSVGLGEYEKNRNKYAELGAPVLTDSHAHFPDTAVVVCDKCQHRHTEAERLGQIRHGEWKATAISHKVAGFHLNQIISPWVPLSDMAREFLESKDDMELLKTWTNTALGETFEEMGETTEWGTLHARREPYVKVPNEAVLITAGVDVQDNRLEVELIAWGDGKESWSMEYAVLMGDPGTADLWRRLDEHLLKTLEREDGRKLHVSSVCVDSGGHYTKEVYNFCKARQRRHVYAIKGVDGQGKLAVSRARKKYERNNAPLVLVGVDTIKETLLLSWLRMEKVGAGYCHFPSTYAEEYFRQLTAEKQVTEYKKGFPHKVWTIRKGVRNEALDCRVYAIAAMELLNPNFEMLRLRVEATSVVARAPVVPQVAAAQTQQDSWGSSAPPPPGPGYMNERPF